MSNAFISLFIAAGTAAWVYSKLGRRVGYGNTQNIWVLVGGTFVLVFLVFLILLSTLLHLNK